MLNPVIKTNGISQIDKYPEGLVEEGLLEYRETPAFHIGQSYEDEPCMQVFCTKCGGDKFIVGESHFFTAIKCPNCEYEVCVHAD